MTTPLFSSAGQATHHEGMLIVKTRPRVRRFAAALADRTLDPEALMDSPGLSSLAFLERAGRIRRITPLSRQAERIFPGYARSVAVLVAAQVAVPEEDPNAGVCLVEAHHDEDVSELQVSLASDPHVEYVSRVPVRYLQVFPSPVPEPPLPPPGAGILAVPPAASTMWNLLKIQWAAARKLPAFVDADGRKIAVLDTGVDTDHPDLEGRIKKYVHAHPDDPNASSEKDIVGHGTHVAGTIAALANNGIGINGICSGDLFVWKIFDDGPDFDPESGRFGYFVNPVMYRRALADCIEERVDVVNLSIGGPGEPDRHELELFKRLLDNDTAVVAAMGNERQIGSPKSYPAAIPRVIAVGATTINDTIAAFSNQGSHIALSAPGVAIWSTLPGYPGQIGFSAVPGPGGRLVPGSPQIRETDYDAWPGTSMATPHVSASVALLFANKGKMTPDEALQHLQDTADKVPAMKGKDFDSDFGAGRLNLLKLLS